MDELAKILASFDTLLGWSSSYRSAAEQHGFGAEAAEQMSVDFHALLCRHLALHAARSAG